MSGLLASGLGRSQIQTNGRVLFSVSEWMGCVVRLCSSELCQSVVRIEVIHGGGSNQLVFHKNRGRHWMLVKNVEAEAD